MARRDQFGSLHARYVAELGASTGTDLFWFALGEALSAIHDRDWPWGHDNVSSVTVAPIVPDVTFSGTARDQYLHSSGDHGLTYANMGRKFLWDGELYRIVDHNIGTYDLTLDRPLHATLSDQTLSFVRDEICINTSLVHGVWVAGQRAEKLLQSDLNSAVTFLGTPFYGWSEGEPYRYIPRDGMVLVGPQGQPQTPQFPPACTAGAAQANFPGGVYRYFFTRVDMESGLESEPGPMLEYTHTAGYKIVVTYDHGSFDVGGYGLRLYRSEVNPTRDNCAMFLISVGSATAFSATDSNHSVKGLYRYMDAPHTVIQLVPPPDSEARSVVIERSRPFNSRPHAEDYIELGTEDAVHELLRMFLAGISKLRNHDTQAVRTQIISFRSQLDYISQRIRGSERGDESGNNHVDFAQRKFLRPRREDLDFLEGMQAPPGEWET